MKRVVLRGLRCVLRGERYFEETESPSAVRTTGAGFGFHAGFFAGAFAAASAAAHATSSAHAAGRRRRGSAALWAEPFMLRGPSYQNRAALSPPLADVDVERALAAGAHADAGRLAAAAEIDRPRLARLDAGGDRIGGLRAAFA